LPVICTVGSQKEKKEKENCQKTTKYKTKRMKKYKIYIPITSTKSSLKKNTSLFLQMNDLCGKIIHQ